MTDLALYNTMSRKKEPFAPAKEGLATIYTCGPTVYDQVQIGNLRAFVAYDVLVRSLGFFGFDVHHVMNLTDVDDKTIRRSLAEGVSLETVTERYIARFFEDLGKLHIQKAWRYPKATEHIDQMVTLVKTLIDKGLTYESGGSTYFRIADYPGYGRLSGVETRTLKANIRVDNDEYEKEEAADFVLWKGWKEEDGDVFWETDIGKGRPGWHIECSAMAMEYLGETVDIHAGGKDLIFPHHENEIAQAEAATGKPFVRYWVHNGWLLAEGKKMSKSLGNYYVLADIEKQGHHPLDLRYFFLTNHYRQQFNHTADGIAAAGRARRRIADFTARLEEMAGPRDGDEGAALTDRYSGEFRDALGDDLNTPRALGALHQLMNETNRLESENRLTPGAAAAVLDTVRKMDTVLAILPEVSEAELTEKEADLLARRQAAREAKDYALSDALREELAQTGVVVEDTPEGQRWKRE